MTSIDERMPTKLFANAEGRPVAQTSVRAIAAKHKERVTRGLARLREHGLVLPRRSTTTESPTGR